jgi:phosphatidate cytidylyltransferase
LKQRVLTAIVGIPIVMAACFCTQPWFFGFIVLLIAFIGCQELARIGERRFAVTGVLLPTAVLVLLTASAHPPIGAVHYGVLLVLFILGITFAGQKGQIANELATLYVGTPLAAAILMQRLGSEDLGFWHVRNFILLVLIPLWVGDSAAIFAGKAWGKHLLAPTISPKKTWEGGIANLVGCVLAGWGVAYFLQAPPMMGLASGLVSGTFGQAGDLYESALKRRAGVKDSGSILPGHGGVLDRIDSLLATAIPVALVVCLWPK